MKKRALNIGRRMVVSETNAKQGSRRRMNLQVLLGSMGALTLIGAAMLFVFFQATPAGMDATPTGADAPASTAPAMGTDGDRRSEPGP